MRSKVGTGMLAGLFAGVLLSVLMQVMRTTAPDGADTPMLMMVARLINSNSIAAAWVLNLAISTILGGVYGAFLGTGTRTYGTALGTGLLYGVAWWVLGGLIAMPLALGDPMFSPVTTDTMRTTAVGSLAGNAAFGVVLGLLYVALHKGGAKAAVRPA